jgi:hypothetical protein
MIPVRGKEEHTAAEHEASLAAMETERVPTVRAVPAKPNSGEGVQVCSGSLRAALPDQLTFPPQVYANRRAPYLAQKEKILKPLQRNRSICGIGWCSTFLCRLRPASRSVTIHGLGATVHTAVQLALDCVAACPGHRVDRPINIIDRQNTTRLLVSCK